jgi:hypothetical protein
MERREPQCSSAFEAANESATATEGDESGREVSFFLAHYFEEEMSLFSSKKMCPSPPFVSPIFRLFIVSRIFFQKFWSP